MGIRLIAFDLDGTILDDEKCLPERNRLALAACAKRGIFIVPCTGRMASGIPKEILETGVRYAITINGAAIEDLETGETLDRRCLDKEVALDVIRLAEARPRVMCDAYVDRRGISEARYYDHLEDFGISPAVCRLIRQTRSPVPDVKACICRPEARVDKVNLFFADMKEREFFRERLNEMPQLLVTSSVSYNLEINSAAASKGDALVRLAAHLGIDIRDTMAFGDGENDASLLRRAGFGVAMGNAEEPLKASADYVTAGNCDAGVAQAIEKWILR